MVSLREKAATLPQVPGVYLWKGRDGGVLYVGKAERLRARVLQYFGTQAEERKEDLMRRATDVEFVAVGTAKEALVLEQTLVKQHRPPYNVLMMDDKRYPYLSIPQEEWPRVVYTRDLAQKGTFFGPFPDAYKAKRVAKMLNQSFGLRQCRTLPTRECLYYHMHQCTAPCIAAVTREAYAAQVDAARAFLKGRAPELAQRVGDEMAAAAKEQRYERAAELRDLQAALKSVVERQRVELQTNDDCDALGLAERGGRWCALLLLVRKGAVVGRETYFLSAPQGSPSATVVGSFLAQRYASAPAAPRNLLLPVPTPESGALQDLLSQVHGHPVELRVPERGKFRQFVELAEKNASEHLEQDTRLRERSSSQGLEVLKDALQLEEPPAQIECFDVSHHGGEHTVASLVVLRDGKPWKAGYRRFKMRRAGGGDDPGAIAEAVSRRYDRVLREEGADALPDLIVIDGGPTQLSAARAELAKLGLAALPIVGLAKKREELYRPSHAHPLRLDAASPGLHVLQRARDEAHRFAIMYQGKLKRKALIASALDEIAGVGPERRRRLLTTFGSVDGVRSATVEEIAAVPGIPGPLAERISTALRAQKPSSPGPD